MEPEKVEREVARIVKINAMAGHHFSEELIESLRRELREDVDMLAEGDRVMAELKAKYGRR